jgi:hypothetical protein
VETLSIVGGVIVSLIASKNLACPGDRIACPDARRLRPRPKLEVLWAVVVSNTISVVYGFFRQQVAAENLFHHDDVFEYILPLSGPWMTRGPDHDVSSLVTATRRPTLIRSVWLNAWP